MAGSFKFSDFTKDINSKGLFAALLGLGTVLGGSYAVYRFRESITPYFQWVHKLDPRPYLGFGKTIEAKPENGQKDDNAFQAEEPKSITTSEVPVRVESPQPKQQDVAPEEPKDEQQDKKPEDKKEEEGKLDQEDEDALKEAFTLK